MRFREEYADPDEAELSHLVELVVDLCHVTPTVPRSLIQETLAYGPAAVRELMFTYEFLRPCWTGGEDDEDDEEEEEEEGDEEWEDGEESAELSEEIEADLDALPWERKYLFLALILLEDRESADLSFWPLVALAVSRSELTIPAFRDVLERADPRPALAVHMWMAADGLARVGEPAVDTLADCVRSPVKLTRMWSYAALGWMEDRRSLDVLMDAARTEMEVPDAAALALGSRRAAVAIDLVEQLLERCQPWQAVAVRAALVDLRSERPPTGPRHEDWRLRYRVDAVTGMIGPPVALALHSLHMEAAEGPIEPWEGDPVEEAVATLEGARSCGGCGRAMWKPTGYPVCPDTAAAIPYMQYAWLLRQKSEGAPDMTAALDELDWQAALLWMASQPGDEVDWEERGGDFGGPEAARGWLPVMRGACAWLLARGIEDIDEALACLAAEALALAREHGDPAGVEAHLAIRIVRMPPEHFLERGDPCPCGSGRSFGGCCAGGGPTG